MQHADDQINDGTTITGEPHEVAGNPIGNAIESYQGFATCDIFYERLYLDTDFTPILDTDGTPIGEGYQQYAEEAPIEQHKVIEFEVEETTFYRFRFRLKALSGSSHTISEYQYVMVAAHDRRSS